MKKIVMLVLCFVMVLSLVSCGTAVSERIDIPVIADVCDTVDMESIPSIDTMSMTAAEIWEQDYIILNGQSVLMSDLSVDWLLNHGFEMDEEDKLDMMIPGVGADGMVSDKIVCFYVSGMSDADVRSEIMLRFSNMSYEPMDVSDLHWDEFCISSGRRNTTGDVISESLIGDLTVTFPGGVSLGDCPDCLIAAYGPFTDSEYINFVNIESYLLDAYLYLTDEGLNGDRLSFVIDDIHGLTGLRYVHVAKG